MRTKAFGSTKSELSQQCMCTGKKKETIMREWGCFVVVRRHGICCAYDRAGLDMLMQALPVCVTGIECWGPTSKRSIGCPASKPESQAFHGPPNTPWDKELVCFRLVSSACLTSYSGHK